MPTTDESSTLPLRGALPYLLIFAGLFFVNFASRVILGPFLPMIEIEFGISHTQAGGLFLPISLGMSISMVLSSIAARLLRHRGAILLSTFAIGLTMIAVSRAPNMPLLRLYLLLMGMAGGLYFPSAISAITSILEHRHWGKGLAVHELAPNAAFIVIPALGAILAEVVSWRTVFAGFGVLGLCMGVLFIIKGRGGEQRGQTPSPAMIFQEVLLRPAFWGLALLFSLAIAASFGPYSMLSLYLIDEVHMDVERANMVLMASRMAGPLVALTSGIIVDRIGARATAALSLGLTGTLTACLGLFSDWGLIAAAIGQPILAVCFFPAGLTAVSLAFPDRVRNIAVSFIVPVAVLLGSGLTPPALGWFGDRGDFAGGFVWLGVLITAGVLPLKFMRFSKRD
ncbi:putative narK gene product [Desulfovibrio ferrophilus]|uniref:Putative narK gene product n=1 Tax=Desulfovibrio ferrophilus TaxID=241368 RepID=A0A2Z6B0F4_9BACT|nr:putative narK gene product [Desulfovibrio ferrophilus]